MFAWFCNGFLQSTVIYTFVAIKPFRVPKHDVLQCFRSAYLPKPLKMPLFPCCLQFFHVPLALGNSNIYKKSFQNIVFHSVCTMFPSKNTVIYTFLAIKSVQTNSFCSVFNDLASKNLAQYPYLRCFFTFSPVSPLPEAYQNDPRFHVKTCLRSDTQKIDEKSRAIRGPGCRRPRFPNLGSFHWVLFSLFPPWGRPKLGNFKEPTVFAWFCNGFLQSTVMYTFVAIKPSRVLKHDVLHCFTMFPVCLSPRTLENVMILLRAKA